MIKLRKSTERGHFNHGWLDTYHTFSFGRYLDRAQMGFRCLRVINEDYVSEGQGFGKHPHDNMEIITYVISGELKHEDSMGNGSIIKAGDVQQMSAGTGVFHSEFNPSSTNPVHLYQIWIEPDQAGYQPSYDQRSFPEVNNQFVLVASKAEVSPEIIKINQDANMYVANFVAGQEARLPIKDTRYGWLQVISGKIEIGTTLGTNGDGISLTAEDSPTIKFLEDSKVLFFDLP